MANLEFPNRTENSNNNEKLSIDHVNATVKNIDDFKKIITDAIKTQNEPLKSLSKNIKDVAVKESNIQKENNVKKTVKTPKKKITEETNVFKNIIKEVSNNYNEQLKNINKEYKLNSVKQNQSNIKNMMIMQYKTIKETLGVPISIMGKSLSELGNRFVTALGVFGKFTVIKTGQLINGAVSVFMKLKDWMSKAINTISSTIKNSMQTVFGDGPIANLITGIVSSPIFWVILGIFTLLRGVYNKLLGKTTLTDTQKEFLKKDRKGLDRFQKAQYDALKQVEENNAEIAKAEKDPNYNPKGTVVSRAIDTWKAPSSEQIDAMDTYSKAVKEAKLQEKLKQEKLKQALGVNSSNSTINNVNNTTIIDQNKSTVNKTKSNSI